MDDEFRFSKNKKERIMNFTSFQKKGGTLFACFIIALVTMLSFPADALAKGGKGGSRSSSRSSSKSKPSSRSNTSAKSTKNSNKSWGSSKKSTASKQKTTADKKLHDRAKAQGTQFKDRKSATTAFAAKKGPELKKANPVTFASQPATRPSYVPQNTTVGGNTYNVSYNQSRGGYGYMDALGMFVMYDIMTNRSFVDGQMRSSGYAYGPAPHNNGGMVIISVLLSLVVVVVVFLVLMSKV